MRAAEPVPAENNLTALLRRFELPLLQYATRILGDRDRVELLTVKLRYKEQEGETSKLIEGPFVDRGAQFASVAPDLKFAAAVAEFGMILRDSAYKGNGSLGAVAQWAQEGESADENGYRAGFLALVRKAQELKTGM